MLNGVNDISVALKNSLKDFMTNGGITVLIPGDQGNISSYNQLILTQTNHFLKPIKSQKKKYYRSRIWSLYFKRGL